MNKWEGVGDVPIPYIIIRIVELMMFNVYDDDDDDDGIKCGKIAFEKMFQCRRKWYFDAKIKIHIYLF